MGPVHGFASVSSVAKSSRAKTEIGFPQLLLNFISAPRTSYSVFFLYTFYSTIAHLDGLGLVLGPLLVSIWAGLLDRYVELVNWLGD